MAILMLLFDSQPLTLANVHTESLHRLRASHCHATEFVQRGFSDRNLAIMGNIAGTPSFFHSPLLDLEMKEL